jgi:hypothetical protein
LLPLGDGPCARKGYYPGALAGCRGGEQLNLYIHDQFHECLIQFCRYAVARLHGPQLELGNKNVLDTECRKRNIACAEVFAIVTPPGKIVYKNGHNQSSLDNAPALFVKPVLGLQGKSTDRWERLERCFVNASGRIAANCEDLVEQLIVHAKKAGKVMLVQEALANKEQSYNTGNRALSTVRLVTFRTEDGTIRPIQAGVRVAGAPDAIVDNYHGKGVYFHVNHQSGEIGEGISQDFASKPEFSRTAPITGTAMTGTKLESWNKLVELAVRAHRKLTLDTVCGWDLALTEKGSVIIECNMIPGCDVPTQRVAGGFLGTEYSLALRDQILSFLAQLKPIAADAR